MKPEAILSFLKALGLPNPQVSSKWITGQCPLAPFTHTKGRDTRPSFGVSLETGLFNCFTCRSGSLEALVQELEMHLVQNPQWEHRYHIKMAREVLEGIQNLVEPLPDFTEFTPPGQVFQEWPAHWLGQFLPWKAHPRAVWYLEKGRQEINLSQPVSGLIADQLGLLYDEPGDRIVCPFWNMSGKLAGARGRAINPEAKYQHLDYTWNKIVNNAAVVWYNERALELAADDRMPVVVVEGQFDCAHILQVYPYVVAGLTAKASVEKIEKLKACDGVITMLDNDETGDKAHQRFGEFLGKRLLGRLTYPEELKDPAKVPLPLLKEIFSDLI